MEIIHCDVDALNPTVRQAMESVVGHALRIDQKLVIQVLESGNSDGTAVSLGKSSELPEWCGAFKDLTPEEEAAISKSIASRTRSRDFPATSS